MIRPFQPQDLHRVLALWLAGNLEAHSFIPPAYWRENYGLVSQQLPQADLSVYASDGCVQAFAGMTGNYLAGLFVDKAHRSAGIGKALLDYLKASHPTMTLHVYQKNQRAAAFYRREGFSIQAQGIDQSTGEVEWTMVWVRG